MCQQDLFSLINLTKYLASEVPVGGNTLAIAAHGESRVRGQPSVSRRFAPVSKAAPVGATVLVAHLARSE